MKNSTPVDIVELSADIEESAANLLMQKTKNSPEIEEKFFYKAVKYASESVVALYDEISIEDIPTEIIARKLQQRFSIKMSLGTMFAAEEYKPWLASVKGDIDWYYWTRYRKLLLKNQFPPHVVRSLDNITDQILDHMENPKKEGSWDRRGMVVGHIQSGKTANYTGLTCKAADCGYRVVIVLAGMLNSLRNQTQERLDKDFLGFCTRHRKNIGVGTICDLRRPAYFTTSVEDFKKNVASHAGVTIGDLKEPAILVVKKNTSTLNNLISWLKENNTDKLQKYPMLLIDDEADYASINTKQDGVTAINSKIRELLKLFDQSSYVGYTATPFANIFIDPETDDSMLGDDLFPRDFILSLDPPDNYVGPEQVFSEETELSIVRGVDDNEDILPLRHKIDLTPESLPLSLKEAIQVFVLIRAIRFLRGHINKHNSMMINVSRFTRVQSRIKLLVDEYLKEELRPAISNHCMLSESESNSNTIMRELKNLWSKEFVSSGYPWEQVKIKLHEAVAPIEVIEVNSSSSAEPLDYREENYPQGRNLIAVGGLSLSRGLTLEGLTASYFIRNSIMYDTLLQMGRWFGYRDGYSDLCRVYMTAEASGWYGHISKVIEELRAEFRRMKASKMTPQDFGLCVRAHPESLIVTARNKMRSGTAIARQIGLEGRLVETKSLYSKKTAVMRNLQALKTVVKKANKHGRLIDVSTGFSGYFWNSVPSDDIRSFIDSVHNHPASDLTQRDPLLEYIDWLYNNGFDEWDMVLCSVENGRSEISVTIDGLKVNAQFRSRSVALDSQQNIFFKNRRIASMGIEKVGLTPEQINQSEVDANGRTISDAYYRRIRNKPLLMLHLLDCRPQKTEKSLFENGILGWGLSFPGQAGRNRPKKLVQYIVNTVWWKNEYSDLIENEEDLGDEYE